MTAQPYADQPVPHLSRARRWRYHSAVQVARALNNIAGVTTSPSVATADGVALLRPERQAG